MINNTNFSLLYKYIFIFMVISFASILAGCSVLPGQGPSTMDISLSYPTAVQGEKEYFIFKLDPQTADVVEKYVPSIFTQEFGSSNHFNNPITLGIDDQLTVNIWEASPDGLFSTIEKKYVEIKTKVDENGDIFFPYVGNFKAVHKTIEETRKIIQACLEGKAVEPQVQVVLSANRSNKITIVGDVATPGQYPVSIRGMRLMEAIAQAGGTKQATFESEVTIVRHNIQGILWLDETIKTPKKNIWLAADDVVQILHRPRSFSAFGAVETKHLIPFKTETLTLAEALAQVGGLKDDLADSGGVFLFRFEEPGLINLLSKQGLDPSEEKIATIYRLDFKNPGSFFLASSFSMKDKDILYVANAPAAEFKKFFTTIVSPILMSINPINNIKK